MKTLVVAEKPSVAKDIVAALTPVVGRFDKYDDHFENENYIITSAVGHLVTIQAPEEFEPKKGRWNFANMPVIPPYFDLVAIDKTKPRLNAVIRLMKRKDVNILVNACDAGREGELIFGLIEKYAGGEKKTLGKEIKRLWMQSMTPDAIREGFKNLLPFSAKKGLADAAFCRSEADWLIGINGTRAMTAFNSQDGGFVLTTVGRVQTPTLSLTVEREQKIKAHQSRKYFEVHANFKVQSGNYLGKWFNPEFKKDPNDPEQKADRIWNPNHGMEIHREIHMGKAVVTEESKPASSSPGALYDLTTLQREANSRFGFSAKSTLSIAQALYEKHKCCTYPRTDSRHLPEDYVNTVKDTLKVMTGLSTGNVGTFAKQALAENMVYPNKRIFDNKKISDHFAIIPTKTLPSGLSEQEMKIYLMIARRFMAVFFPQAEFMVTTRISVVDKKHHFKSEGKVMVKPGWTAIYARDEEDNKDKDKTLTAVLPGELAAVLNSEVKDFETKPPARYTEASLLGAMEHAGKTIESEELKDFMKEKGLGTPATRAAIIEGLIHEEYIVRDGKDLVPTSKAFQLMTLLHSLDVDVLTKAELTGSWEQKLSMMEKGEVSREEFMKQISDMTKSMVEKAKSKGSSFVPDTAEPLKAPCPSCQGKMVETYKRFSCAGSEGKPGCGFNFSKTPASRFLSTQEAEELLTKKEVGPLKGFKSKTGWPFEAKLAIVPDPEKPGSLKATLVFLEDKPKTTYSLEGRQDIGKCPCCGSKVYDTEKAYVCEVVAGAKKGKCTFRMSKEMLGTKIDQEQAVKLLTTTRTDKLTFIGKTKRPFEAMLHFNKRSGRVEFEFEKKAKPKKQGPD